MNFIEFILEKSKYISILVIVGIIIYGFLGKLRWQYYPIYLLGLLYFVLILMNYFKVLELNQFIVRCILGIIIFLVSSTILLSLGFPTDEVPIPSGPFKVGTRIYDLEDKSRDEVYTDNEVDKRKIKYQIWYPTDNIDGLKKIKWINDGVILTRQLAKNMRLPFFILDHTAEINSNSYYNAPLSNALENYPVVIISHGWSGFRELHTDYAEELASNGFIAISIDHTYGSQAVKFQDGSVAYLNERALPKVEKFNESTILVKTYGEDVGSVLNELENINNNKYFKGKLDLNSIGLLGHSTGGGGDVYASLKDKDVKALMGLDAWLAPMDSKSLKQGLSIPLLFLRSEQWSVGPNNAALNELISNSDDATIIQLNKTNHIDFSMSYMYSPLSKYIGFTGKLPGRQSSEIQRELILKFFDNNLRNKNNNKKYLKEMVDKYEILEFVDLE